MPLSAIDAASLATPFGVAIYLALIAGLRGEQVVFILFLGGWKVGTFPKTQARNTVSGDRRAERPISDSRFRKEILPLPSQVLHVAPKQNGGFTSCMVCAASCVQYVPGGDQATSYLIRQ